MLAPTEDPLRSFPARDTTGFCCALTGLQQDPVEVSGLVQATFPSRAAICAWAMRSS